MDFERYGLYVMPPATAPWAAFCIQWLGWDAEAGQSVAHPDLPGFCEPVSALTAVPRRYGLHATIKPPFRLASGRTRRALAQATEELTHGLAPVTLDGLVVTPLGRFLALTATGDCSALNAMASQVVRVLDPFRAPATPQELAKRRSAQLSRTQEANLTRWGYPHVMEGFRFHITLTSKLPRDTLVRTQNALETHLTPLLPRPVHITDLALVGEDADGMFHLLHRFALRG